MSQDWKLIPVIDVVLRSVLSCSFSRRRAPLLPLSLFPSHSLAFRVCSLKFSLRSEAGLSSRLFYTLATHLGVKGGNFSFQENDEERDEGETETKVRISLTIGWQKQRQRRVA